jgi:hypothetical protein
MSKFNLVFLLGSRFRGTVLMPSFFKAVNPNSMMGRILIKFKLRTLNTGHDFDQPRDSKSSFPQKIPSF